MNWRKSYELAERVELENAPFLAQEFLVWQVRMPVQGPQVGQGN